MQVHIEHTAYAIEVTHASLKIRCSGLTGPDANLGGRLFDGLRVAPRGRFPNSPFARRML